jgi:hypothetical protein
MEIRIASWQPSARMASFCSEHPILSFFRKGMLNVVLLVDILVGSPENMTVAFACALALALGR